MSVRDKKFLERCGLTVSSLARILNKSRQHISTQINKNEYDDFLNEHYLVRIYMYIKNEDPDICDIILVQINKIFPEYYDIVQNVVKKPIQSPSSFECEGEEYWFITGDLRSILKNICVVEALEKIMANGCPVTFVTIQKEEEHCRYFFERGNLENYIPCPVDDVDLGGVPTILLKMVGDGVQMYGVSDSGFVPLSSAEGERMRAKFEKIIRGSSNK